MSYPEFSIERSISVSGRFSRVEIVVGVDQAIQVHHWKTREVPDDAGVPRPDHAVLGKHAIHKLRTPINSFSPFVVRNGFNPGPPRFNTLKWLGEIGLGKQEDRAGNYNAHTQNVCRPGRPRSDETADEVNGDVTSYGNDQRHQQVRRDKIPRPRPQGRVNRENSLCEFGQMASRQAETRPPERPAAASPPDSGSGGRTTRPERRRRRPPARPAVRSRRREAARCPGSSAPSYIRLPAPITAATTSAWSRRSPARCPRRRYRYMRSTRGCRRPRPAVVRRVHREHGMANPLSGVPRPSPSPSTGGVIHASTTRRGTAPRSPPAIQRCTPGAPRAGQRRPRPAATSTAPGFAQRDRRPE